MYTKTTRSGNQGHKHAATHSERHTGRTHSEWRGAAELTTPHMSALTLRLIPPALGATKLSRPRKAMRRETRVTTSNPSDRQPQATEELSALG